MCDTNCKSKDTEQLGPSQRWWEREMVHPRWKRSGIFLQSSTRTCLTIQQAHSRQMKPYGPSKTCRPMIIVALFIIGKSKKKNWTILKLTQMPFNCEQIICWISAPWNTTQQRKGIKCWFVQQLGWISTTSCWAEDAILNSSHTVSIHVTLYKSQGYKGQTAAQGLLGWGWGDG